MTQASPKPRAMWSPVGVLWTLLSTIVACLTTFSFLQPYWFINRRTYNSLGMYSYCSRDMSTKGTFALKCRFYGFQEDTFHFSNLPSNAWQVSCVLYGAGSLFLCLSACLGIITVCLPKTWDKRLSAATGYIQATAVVIMVAGLLIYPTGLDNKYVRHYCPEAGVYSGGQCQIGWSYLLGVVGTSLAVFTPFLSQYTDLNLQETQNSSSSNTQASGRETPREVTEYKAPIYV